jgi:predicted MFS family arabinose efflux permease
MMEGLASVKDARLGASFAIGACILFAFIGTFTYINFVLVNSPHSLGMMSLGLVYLVFLPSIVTTPLAGRLAERIGTREALWAGLGLALLGLVGVLTPSLPAVLAGLVLVGVGTFLAQATTTGYVAKVARATGASTASASGLYLAAYFLGGLLGSVMLGIVFDRWGWTATVAGIALSLLLACALARQLRKP